MGFPHDALTREEEVVQHGRQHWHLLLLPGFWAVVLVTAVITTWVVLPTNFFGRVLLVLVTLVFVPTLWLLGVLPFIIWRTTQHAFTNKRVMTQRAVLRQRHHDIPLNRVNDVDSDQGLLDRLFGCGTLVLGADDSDHLHHIPDVRQARVLVNDLIHGAGHERHTDVTALERKMRSDTPDKVDSSIDVSRTGARPSAENPSTEEL